MSVSLVPEDDLRAALRPYRVATDAFEAAVRARLNASLSRVDDPIAGLSPALRSAAAFLPLEILTGGQLKGAAKLAPATGVYKMLSYAAFPAISLFVLLGATVFSVLKIRSIRLENESIPLDDLALRESTKQWWHDHKWGVPLLVAGTIAMAWFGATWLLFLGYIASFALLLYVLKSFARIGLGNRLVIGQSCLFGLVLLGQVAGFCGIGDQDIHLIDQQILVPLFFWGAMLVGLILGSSTISVIRSRITTTPGAGRPSRGPLWVVSVTAVAAVAVFTAIVVLLTARFMAPILWPATPARIKAYVESFDNAPFSSASWRQWEIVARWAVESKLDPDLAGPRRLLAAEMAGEQNPFILGSAFRVGLVRVDQLRQLRKYAEQRRVLLDDPTHFKETQPIPSLDQEDWLIRAAALRNDLTPDERDYLAKRLRRTLEVMSTDPHVVLETPLLATQLLAVIGRPVDAARYRDRVHDLLRKFHSKRGGGFQVAGGFKSFNLDNIQVGSLDATSCAVELMEIYGIPADLDLNWVRSFLRPMSSIRQSPEKWIAAVTLERLNLLPGVTHPTWLETLYYERSLLAALVLVGLCIYATLASPKPRVVHAAGASPQAESMPGQDQPLGSEEPRFDG
jgi:hypothetical protein